MPHREDEGQGSAIQTAAQDEGDDIGTADGMKDSMEALLSSRNEALVSSRIAARTILTSDAAIGSLRDMYDTDEAPRTRGGGAGGALFLGFWCFYYLHSESCDQIMS